MLIVRGRRYKIHFPSKRTRLSNCVDVISAGQEPSLATINKYYENPPERVLKQVVKPCKLDRWIFQFDGTDHYAVIPDTPRNADWLTEVYQ